MSYADLSAEAARLKAEMEAILHDDTKTYFAQRAADGRPPMPMGWQLSLSTRSRPLRNRLMEIRAQLEEISGPAPAAAISAPSATPTTRNPNVTSDPRFSQSDVNTIVALALAQQSRTAPPLAAPAAALSAVEEIDAVAARIARSDELDGAAGASTSVSAGVGLTAGRGDDIDEVARRIAQS